MVMRRREFLGAVAGGVTAFAGLSSPSMADPGAETARPSVIYAFSDEHRWHSMNFTRMPALRTPNMNRLPSQGIAFSQCISNYPVCSPHRAMLMTGRWPYQQAVIDNGIPLTADQVTLGKTFQAAGYDTAYIGKWHLGGVRAEPFGFGHSLIWTNDDAHWDRSQFHPGVRPPVQPKGYNATLMSDQALKFIRRSHGALSTIRRTRTKRLIGLTIRDVQSSGKTSRRSWITTCARLKIPSLETTSPPPPEAKFQSNGAKHGAERPRLTRHPERSEGSRLRENPRCLTRKRSFAALRMTRWRRVLTPCVGSL